MKYAQDPDEYFVSVDYTTFDGNGDTFHDRIEMAINVDTTYNGSLGVYVYIYLVYPNGSSGLPAIVGWGITYVDPTLQIISFGIAPGDPEGLYDVELHLFDESYNFEDYWFISDVYLYPPYMRELTIQVGGSGTTSPAPGSWWVPNGTEFGVEAFPDSGWMLHHWVLDTVDTEPDNPILVNMDNNHILTAVFAELPVGATVESCNLAGDQKDNFDLGETVYVTGGNYSPSATYDFYIVVDEETWSNGMSIPERVPDTATTISSNMDGHIPPTAVWGNPQNVGNYDVVVDVNGNGQYDAEIDALDNDDIEVTAGFIIIPEFQSFLILSLFIMVTLLAAIVRRKHSM